MKKIIFSDKFGLTQAVLDGRKTMIRSLEMDCNIRFYLNEYENTRIVIEDNRVCIYSDEEELLAAKPNRYKVGEVVAIAQSYQNVYDECGLETMDCLVQSMKISKGWNNKMFTKADLLPHHIRITDVKIERLQDISEEDFLKEGGLVHSAFDGINRFKTPNLGVRGYLTSTDYKDCFQFMIDKVQGKGTWNSNPYVWAYEFELID